MSKKRRRKVTFFYGCSNAMIGVMQKGIDFTGITTTFMCHDGQGNFLLSKRGTNCRDEHGCWDPGGGGLEFGHRVEESLVKEIKEEYCTDVLDFQFLGYRDVHRVHNGTPTHWLSLDFLVHVDRKQVKNGEPHKLDEIGWFTLDNFPSPQHSQLPAFLKDYKKEMRKVSK